MDPGYERAFSIDPTPVGGHLMARNTLARSLHDLGLAAWFGGRSPAVVLTRGWRPFGSLADRLP